MNKAYTIKRLYLDGNGQIDLVNYQIDYTDDLYPGITSVNVGVRELLSPLDETATDEEIISALIDALAPDAVGIDDYHQSDIVLQFKLATSTLIDRTEPPIGTPLPTVTAITQFTLVDGDIASVDLTAGFSFVMVPEPGVAWAFFEQPMATMAYAGIPSSSQGIVRVTAGGTLDYIELSMNDDSGNPLQTGTIALQIFRVV